LSPTPATNPILRRWGSRSYRWKRTTTYGAVDSFREGPTAINLRLFCVTRQFADLGNVDGATPTYRDGWTARPVKGVAPSLLNNGIQSLTKNGYEVNCVR
jgi:hypothetical protein